MKIDPKPSRRYGEYLRKLACDEWESLGPRGSDKGVLAHKPTGATVAYNLHDGGNDWNGPRNFALEIQRVCGCVLIEPRGRKRSRKSVTAADAQVEAARAKHLAEHGERLEHEAAARAEANDLEQRRAAAAARAAESARRERDIASLMRPGRY